MLENITHYLADNRERITAMQSALEAEPRPEHLPTRVEILHEWNRQFAAAISAASETIAARQTATHEGPQGL
jgi:hypothetical protein